MNSKDSKDMERTPDCECSLCLRILNMLPVDITTRLDAMVCKCPTCVRFRNVSK